MQVQQYSSPTLSVSNNIPKYHQPLPTLTKHTTSSSTTIDGSRSSSSIDNEAAELEYLKLAIQWVLKLRKKMSISKDTLYVAIAYLNKLVGA